MQLAKFVPWFSRLVLVAAMLILVLIGRKFIADPVGAAAASNMVLGSPLAITNMRASFGAFPLGAAIFTLFCLMSAHRRLTGLCFVAIIIGTALMVRLFGIAADHTLTESLRVLVAESVLLTLSMVALLAEFSAQRRYARA